MQRLKYFVIFKNGSSFWRNNINITSLGCAFDRGYKSSFKVALYLNKKEFEEFKEELKYKGWNIQKVTKLQYQKLRLNNWVKG